MVTESPPDLLNYRIMCEIFVREFLSSMLIILVSQTFEYQHLISRTHYKLTNNFKQVISRLTQVVFITNGW